MLILRDNDWAYRDYVQLATRAEGMSAAVCGEAHLPCAGAARA